MTVMEASEPTVPPSPLTVPDLWREAVLRFAARPLLHADAEAGTLTYADADELVTALSRRLAACGLGKGDRVVLCTPFHPEAVLVCWAAMALGAVVAPLDPGLPEASLAGLCGQLEPALLFCGSGHDSMTGVIEVVE